MADRPQDHPQWLPFLAMVDESPSWSFVGEHRDNATLQLWAIYRQGFEAGLTAATLPPATTEHSDVPVQFHR